MPVPRLLPDLPLPERAYRPGRGARPDAEFAEPGPCPTGAAWRTCRPFLRGIDLFNHGYPWEAHEVWEGLWHHARRDPALAAEASLLRGLIQLAAVAVLARDGRSAGAARVARRAAEHLRAAGPERRLGLDPPALAAAGTVDAIGALRLVPTD